MKKAAGFHTVKKTAGLHTAKIRAERLTSIKICRKNACYVYAAVVTYLLVDGATNYGAYIVNDKTLLSFTIIDCG